MDNKEWINKIHKGDVLDVLKKMPDNFVDMSITSPPYYNLRNYGDIDGQIGLEIHPQEFIDKLVEVFHELKRVLKPTGSFFLNIGDTFFGGNVCVGMPEGWESLSTMNIEKKYKSDKFDEVIKKRNKLRSNWLQPKQLLMIPYRLAAKMQDDGWILRNIICWEKGNPMPSSVRDRFNTSYEPVFFFVKSKKYFFDMDSIREPYKTSSIKRYDHPLGHIRTNAVGLKESTGYHCDKDVDLHPLGKIPNDFFGYEKSKFSSKEEESKHRQGFSKNRNEFEHHPLGRIPTDIFPVNTTSFKGSHFAVFPPELLMKPIKSSCPQQVCKKCGVPRERITQNPDFDYSVNTENIKDTHKRNINDEKTQSTSALHRTGNEGVFYMGKTVGWTKCKCNEGFEPGIVLDPFIGSGTAGIVAKDLNRRWIGIELNPEYIKMAKNRIKKYVVVHEFEVKTDQPNEELIVQNEIYQIAEKHLPKFNTIHKYLDF